MAKFEVYDAAGNVVMSLGDRVLRVLSVSDVLPTATTYTDTEITPGAAIVQGNGNNLTGSVSSGTVNYGGINATLAKRPVILY